MLIPVPLLWTPRSGRATPGETCGTSWLFWWQWKCPWVPTGLSNETLNISSEQQEQEQPGTPGGSLAWPQHSLYEFVGWRRAGGSVPPWSCLTGHWQAWPGVGAGVAAGPPGAAEPGGWESGGGGRRREPARWGSRACWCRCGTGASFLPACLPLQVGREGGRGRVTFSLQGHRRLHFDQPSSAHPSVS